MDGMVIIKGNVKFPITLDPTVWIFDDRRVDLDEFLETEYIEIDEDEKYKEGMGKHWSREIMEGATFPPTLKSESKFEKTKALEKTYAILLEHFFNNAEPHAEATHIIFERTEGDEVKIAMDDLSNVLLQFSFEGKPLKEDGPVYLLWKDGSNANEPIRFVTGIRVE